jgi:hypothetical protein
MILASCGVIYQLIREPAGAWIRVILIGLVVFDLNAYFRGSVNKIQAGKSHSDWLEELVSLQGAASFLKTKALPFRAAIAKDPQANIGDAYGIPSPAGGGVTFLIDYIEFWLHPDLLNVRYLIKPASSGDPGPIYQDAQWKVYENPKGFPHAWLVHDTAIEPSNEALYRKFGDGQTDLHKIALLTKPLPQTIEPAVNESAESVTFESYTGRNMKLHVSAQSAGLLVLSELHYPGWHAELNGRPANILKVDGALQGIIVPRGQSRLSIQFTPLTAYVGGVISILTCLVVLVTVFWMRRTGEFRLWKN